MAPLFGVRYQSKVGPEVHKVPDRQDKSHHTFRICFFFYILHLSWWLCHPSIIYLLWGQAGSIILFLSCPKANQLLSPEILPLRVFLQTVVSSLSLGPVTLLGTFLSTV